MIDLRAVMVLLVLIWEANFCANALPTLLEPHAIKVKLPTYTGVIRMFLYLYILGPL